MTATTVRRLNFRQHPNLPADREARAEFYVEFLLSRAHDYGEPELLDVLTLANPVAADRIALGIETLYDLADEIESATRFLDAGDDEWAAPREIVVSEYAEHLRKLARLVRGR